MTDLSERGFLFESLIGSNCPDFDAMREDRIMDRLRDHHCGSTIAVDAYRFRAKRNGLAGERSDRLRFDHLKHLRDRVLNILQHRSALISRRESAVVLISSIGENF